MGLPTMRATEGPRRPSADLSEERQGSATMPTSCSSSSTSATSSASSARSMRDQAPASCRAPARPIPLLLTKALRPLPEKWHGLTDVETRYRQRYSTSPPTRSRAQVFEARAALVKAIREFLDARGFLEVETPMMHAIPGGAAARPFMTHHNALDMELYLRIAPELYLKRLRRRRLRRASTRSTATSATRDLDAPQPRVHDARVLRRTRLRDADGLHRGAAPARRRAPSDRARRPCSAAWARPSTFSRALSRAVRCGDADRAAPGRARRIAPTTPSKMRAPSPRARIDWRNFGAGARMHRRRLARATSRSSSSRTTAEAEPRADPFIIDYPFEVSPLARKKDADPALVDRFELFVHGPRALQRASASSTIRTTRPRASARRWSRSEAGDEETMDYDDDYVRALEHGMPPAAGFGMGIDRLTMMLTDAPSIRDVILFPLLRPRTQRRRPRSRARSDAWRVACARGWSIAGHRAGAGLARSSVRRAIGVGVAGAVRSRHRSPSVLAGSRTLALRARWAARPRAAGRSACVVGGAHAHSRRCAGRSRRCRCPSASASSGRIKHRAASRAARSLLVDPAR